MSDLSLIDPNNPATAQIIKTATELFVKKIWDSAGSWFIQGRDEKETERKIREGLEKYVQNYLKRHGTLKVLGMREPIPLESVYIAVQFLDNHSLLSFESPETLEESFRQQGRRGFRDIDCPKQEGMKVVNEKPYLTVLGGPGAGKSTFLRRVGLEALKDKQGEFSPDCFPVFLELKKFTSDEIDIKAEIVREFFICGVPSAEECIEKALEQGSLLILLDGLDEVPTENMSEAINQIQDFVDSYDKNRFIISCRVAAYRNNFRRFTDVAMADFDDEKIENFIKNWFKNELELGKDCLEKLNSPEHSAAKELTQTPLLLTLVCLLYQRSRKFPTNRATLYEKALRVLLEEWAGEKNIPQEDLYKGLDTKRKELMLAEIAHDAFQEDRLFLPRRELGDQIEKILKEMLSEEKHINGEQVLKSIERQHGVIVERAERVYSFSHLTIQEYLTAFYISSDFRKIEKLVNEHVEDVHWQEVFLLIAGSMQKADELLLLMEKRAQDFIKSSKLKQLLQWTEQITVGSEGNLKPAAKRTLILFYALILALLLNQANSTKFYDIHGQLSWLVLELGEIDTSHDIYMVVFFFNSSQGFYLPSEIGNLKPIEWMQELEKAGTVN
jgi:predicted NACHT family NTPase